MTTEEHTAEKPAAPDPFAALEVQAGALDLAAVPPDPDAPEPVSRADQVRANRDLLDMLYAMAVPMMPAKLAEAYDDGARQRIAEAYTDLAIKRGWDLGELLGAWGAEIALVAALFGPAMPYIMATVAARKAPGQTAAPTEPRA